MVRKIKAKLVLQLRAHGLSGRAISAGQGMSRHSVQAVLDAADRAEFSWDDAAGITEADVYAAQFPGRGVRESVFVQPDWRLVHRELARVGVTLKLLHQEYVDAAVRSGQAAMSYDRFRRLYADYALVTGASSRVGHKAGRSVEVDWSGPTMQLLDATTGEVSRPRRLSRRFPVSCEKRFSVGCRASSRSTESTPRSRSSWTSRTPRA